MRHLHIRQSLHVDRRRITCAAVIGIALSVVGGPAGGQDLARGIQLADRGPVFYAPVDARGARTVRVDAGSVAVLRQRITVDLRAATIPEALAAIGDRSGLRFAYDQSILAASARVTLVAEDLTVAAALTQVLLDSHVDLEIGLGGLVSLFPRGAHGAGRAETGALIGRVTDSKTGQRVPFATIVIEGTTREVTASDSGTYRLGGLTAGSYILLGRALGYSPRRASASVVAGQTTEVDLALEKSANPLDRVVVTGTIVPTEVKALPTPVTVVTATEIEAQHIRTVTELFRQLVPSSVGWDYGADPESSPLSIRGASTLDAGNGTVKVYLDGVEISDRNFAAIDPNSIERIEVIRGPEAAAIYGSDAIGGVMQVFTKHGGGGTRPVIDLQAAVGTIESPYAGYSGASRQEYSASMQGGNSAASYNIGAGYTRSGNWVPQGAAQLPSAFGGAHLIQGPVTIDLSARYFAQDEYAVVTPDEMQVGIPSISKPLNRAAQTGEETYGGHITYQATPWWQHTLTLGADRVNQDVYTTSPVLTTPADTFRIVATSTTAKQSIAYNTSVFLRPASNVATTIIIGVDHYTFTNNGFLSPQALNISGSIQTNPDLPSSGTRDVVTNTGYFAQAQIGVWDELFFTGGVRAEQNTNFGPALSTPVSPRVGVAYAHRVGVATVKVRGSFGEAIHPPDPDQKDAAITPSSVVLANAKLGPERQKGWDAGFDVVFGGRASIGVTYYDQTAQDLIQTVLLDSLSLPETFQYQNVARVSNKGLELEGTLTLGLVELRAQYAIARSRAEDLGPDYTGDQLVGEQILGTPERTGGASVSFSPLSGTTVTAGLAYVGAWTYYDFLAEFRCFGGTGPCGDGTTAAFLTRYPSFAKVNLSVTQRVTRAVDAFVSADNLTNEDTPELARPNAAMGRVARIGLHLRY